MHHLHINLWHNITHLSPYCNGSRRFHLAQGLRNTGSHNGAPSWAQRQKNAQLLPAEHSIHHRRAYMRYWQQPKYQGS